MNKNDPKRADHLKRFRFKKGQSGNPSGRPKYKLQSEAYKAELEKEDKQGRTNAEQIARALVAQAKKGKVSAASEIADRVEGKPRQAYDTKLSIIDELAERIEEGRQRVKRDISNGPSSRF